ncbi:hypothetical protein ACFW04_000541 [Cataglyphis niger]
MDVYDDRFYGITRRLMISLGLWPYQNPRYRKLLLVFVSIVYVQGLIFQYTTFITHKFSVKLFIEMMSFNTLLILFIIKYNTVYLNSANVKLLLEQISYDCIAITDTQEIAIIQKYASRGRQYTLYSGLLIYIATALFILTLFIPDILNLVMPTDKPRPRLLPTPVECFIDEQRYFYAIVSDMTIIAVVGMTTFVATETMFMIFIQHACGLFEIASYRITQAFDNCKDNSVISAKLSHAVKIHRRSLQFIEFMNSCFAVSYMVLVIVGVISLSINMLRLFQALENNIFGEILASGVYVLCHFCYMFWVNYFGQYLSDHSESIFEETYSTQWYAAPLHIRKLLLIIMQRSTKISTFNVFSSILIASMEGFASIVSLSVSYFTVLYSIRM